MSSNGLTPTVLAEAAGFIVNAVYLHMYVQYAYIDLEWGNGDGNNSKRKKISRSRSVGA